MNVKLSDVLDISKLTPAMQQYANLKAENQGSLLFFRMGDFYELFFDDAIITAKELNITLTKRGKVVDESIPMCGIPFHAVNNYVPKLVKKGYEIAICEQTSSPDDMLLKGIKGPLNREVTRIITPGTVIEEYHLDSEQNNFLGSILIDDLNFSLSWVDVSTGKFISNTFSYQTKEELKYKIENILNKISISELLVSCKDTVFCNDLSSKIKVKSISVNIFLYDDNLTRLKSYYKKTDLTNTLDKLQIATSGVLLYYLEHTFKKDLPQLLDIKAEEDLLFLEIDKSTMSSLEIINTITGEKKNSLLNVIDQTVTPTGSRLIKERLLAPSRDKKEIYRRQDLAKFLYLNRNFKDELKKNLVKITDFERSLSRISLNLINPKELLLLAENLKIILEIKTDISELKNYNKNLLTLHQNLNVNETLTFQILKAIKKSVINENLKSDFVNEGYDAELDKIKNIQNISVEKIIEFQNKYSKITDINSLKIKYNKVLGYHIEIRSIHLDKMNICHDFIHRQTTAQTIRYTTKELLDLETEIINANTVTNNLENKIYLSFKGKILNEKNQIAEISNIVAQLDIANMTADQKIFKNYVVPEIVDDKYLYIKKGRHPVVEETLPLRLDYSSNDCELKKGNIWLITGPNMAGKSTFLRQNAIIIILAQAGLFIPAEKGKIGLVDKVFSRVGASDNLTKGQSTFMVEMTETASILNRASDKSFIIFDEVGRGTSTYDGLAIAWAIVEHLLKNLKAKVLFATHYHELTRLKHKSKEIKNYKMDVKEWNNKIIFLYKIIKGEANKSYGIEVAKLAGLPKDLIINASQILEGFENKVVPDNNKIYLSSVTTKKSHKHYLETYFDKIDLDNMTPLKALEALFEIKRYLKK